ncbi:hypothetical protein JQ621_03955 [Bradyrhizobium manausense]|uniref:hypothetical protein n=1 Tax=Bradyrhizobium manausense TaxID=989370 RepID=UPI001BAE4C34|nr:hypothetical protein [Bradyrhizobium manausense]MBR1086624.1 hypothetical protein [Bradyrhizobium manausense]
MEDARMLARNVTILCRDDDSAAPCLTAEPCPKRDEIWMTRHRALDCCLRMIFPENRFALFRIML